MYKRRLLFLVTKVSASPKARKEKSLIDHHLETELARA